MGDMGQFMPFFAGQFEKVPQSEANRQVENFGNLTNNYASNLYLHQ